MEESIYLKLLVYAFIFIMPLVPTLIIYLIFPESKIFVKGNLAQNPFFGNLTFKAGGATGAFILLLAISLLIWKSLFLTEPYYHIWKISGKIDPGPFNMDHISKDYIRCTVHPSDMEELDGENFSVTFIVHNEAIEQPWIKLDPISPNNDFLPIYIYFQKGQGKYVANRQGNIEGYTEFNISNITLEKEDKKYSGSTHNATPVLNRRKTR